MANYWLVKQEPEDYSWADFVKDGRTQWTGVRNYTARNNLRGMKSGDLVFYYHSGEQKAVVGISRVSKEAFADPTAEEGNWVAVELMPVEPVAVPVTLAEIKADGVLKEMQLVRQSRLSVSSVNEVQFARLLKLAGTKI